MNRKNIFQSSSANKADNLSALLQQAIVDYLTKVNIDPKKADSWMGGLLQSVLNTAKNVGEHGRIVANQYADYIKNNENHPQLHLLVLNDILTKDKNSRLSDGKELRHLLLIALCINEGFPMDEIEKRAEQMRKANVPPAGINGELYPNTSAPRTKKEEMYDLMLGRLKIKFENALKDMKASQAGVDDDAQEMKDFTKKIIN